MAFLAILTLLVNLAKMKPRYLESSIKDLCLARGKMAFISGPRQSGKTTLAKGLLSERGVGAYYNWDETSFRRNWAKNPGQIIPDSNDRSPIIILDEIHKAKLWKRSLKGLFDTIKKPVDFIVTGSARLNVYKKGSDSLLGRYHHFRIHPFTLREIDTITPVLSDHFDDRIFTRSQKTPKNKRLQLDALMRFGGFPEPFLAADDKVARLWRKGRLEKVIREDLRDLSRLPELSQIETLTSLLPERIGSPFSHGSLREDLEVSFPTVKRWVTYLKELYYLFEIKPYTKSITRSLKKGGKIYLWDYTEITDESFRFENLVACHLLKTCHYWNDTGEGQFDMFYLRDKEKNEIDFLITKDRLPWLPIEAKLNETKPSPNWVRFLNQIGLNRGLQIVNAHGIWESHSIGKSKILVASASEALDYFI